LAVCGLRFGLANRNYSGLVVDSTVNRSFVVSLVFFVFFVLLFTRIDYLVNGDFYEFGLQFSWDWYIIWGILYALLYQSTIVLLHLFHRDWRFTIICESFVLSATQDLIFYLVWAPSFPQGQWVWMPYYLWFGFWTTLNQILFSTLSVGGCIVLILFRSQYRRVAFAR